MDTVENRISREKMSVLGAERDTHTHFSLAMTRRVTGETNAIRVLEVDRFW